MAAFRSPRTCIREDGKRDLTKLKAFDRIPKRVLFDTLIDTLRKYFPEDEVDLLLVQVSGEVSDVRNQKRTRGVKV